MSEEAILVLEDDALIAMDIEMTLSEAGHDKISVHHKPDTALEMIEETAPVAALLDYNLGQGQTSLAVAEELRDRGIPFAFLTGYTNSTVPLPEGLGNVKRIAKPFHAADLVKAIDNMISDE